MATQNLIKKRLATVASAEAHKSDWEEGMEIDLIDEGIEPPIPTTADNGKIVKVANGKYTLENESGGGGTTVSGYPSSYDANYLGGISIDSESYFIPAPVTASNDSEGWLESITIGFDTYSIKPQSGGGGTTLYRHKFQIIINGSDTLVFQLILSKQDAITSPYEFDYSPVRDAIEGTLARFIGGTGFYVGWLDMGANALEMYYWDGSSYTSDHYNYSEMSIYDNVTEI